MNLERFIELEDSKFLHTWRNLENDWIYKWPGHLHIEGYLEACYVGDRSNQKTISRCYTCLGGNLVNWLTKKWNVVFKSCGES